MRRKDKSVSNRTFDLIIRIPIFIVSLCGMAAVALAHGSEEITEKNAWSDWIFTPDIVIPSALIAAIYISGMLRRRTAKLIVPWWRHVLFFAGLFSVFAALQSPIDPIAEHLFFVHQIQHLMLRMIGPMLLAISWPEGLLNAGLPTIIRKNVLVPVVTNNVMRAVFGILAHPVIATVLFIGVLYFWEIPKYHDMSLLNENIHYLMHMTMLLAGLVFFWRIFDRRSPIPAVVHENGRMSTHDSERHARSKGLRYGVRLMMLWLVILSNILLGSLTTFKSTLLYPAYTKMGRLFGYTAYGDEQIGGIIIWIFGTMMCLVAILIVLQLWGRSERYREERRNAQPILPTTGAAMVARTRPQNRAMAIGLSAFVFTVFFAAILVGVLSYFAGSAAFSSVN